MAFRDPLGLAPCCKRLRQAASAVVGLIPIVGEVSDATTVMTGRDVVTGERVGTAGRIAAAAGVLLPFVSGGQLRAAGKFLNAAEEGLARRAGNTFTVRVCNALGGDGASSAHLIEVDAAGSTISTTHRVVHPDGQLSHQHQRHVGKSGAEREFPNEWIQFPDVD